MLVVILNDHSQRGVPTICPFKGKMIPLYRVTPEHPSRAPFKYKTYDNTAFNVGGLKVFGLVHRTDDMLVMSANTNVHKLLSSLLQNNAITTSFISEVSNIKLVEENQPPGWFYRKQKLHRRG